YVQGSRAARGQGLSRLAGRFLIRWEHAAALVRPAGDERDQQGQQRDGQPYDTGDSVDLRFVPQAHGRKDLQRQGGGAWAGDEAGQYQVIQRQGEGEQPAGENRGCDHRYGDLQEGFPGWRTQVQGRFLHRLVQLTEAAADDDGDIGHREGGVGDPDGQHTAVEEHPEQRLQYLRQRHEQQQQR